jgi:pimeloyl-ACP methyl ester carboxylesterase
MSGDMYGLLKSLEIHQVHVVGISLGGTLALQLAVEHPRLVNKLVLVNTFAVLRPDRISVWIYYALRSILLLTLGLPTQARAVARRIFPHPQQEEFRQLLIEQILQADPRAYRATMLALAIFNVKRKLPGIQVPTLIITGENDTTVPPKNQKHLLELIPGSRQITIPSAGHAVTIDQPGLFNRCLIDFLDESHPWSSRL